MVYSSVQVKLTGYRGAERPESSSTEQNGSLGVVMTRSRQTAPVMGDTRKKEEAQMSGSTR